MSDSTNENQAPASAELSPQAVRLRPDTWFGLVVLGLFVLATVCLQLASRIVKGNLDSNEGLFPYMGIGYLVALIDLAALYWVWGRSNVALRTLLLLLTMAAASWVWRQLNKGEMTQMDFEKLHLLLLCQATVVIVCFGSIRLLGTRFTQVSSDLQRDLAAIPDGPRGQMSLLNLLSMVTSTSLILGWLRWIPWQHFLNDTVSAYDIGYELLMVVTPLTAILFISVPTRWYLYAPLAAIWPMVAGYLLVALFDGDTSDRQRIAEVSAVTITHGVILVGTLILFRLAQYRLVWRINSPPPGDQGKAPQAAPTLEIYNPPDE